jgi:hypothetical protein
MVNATSRLYLRTMEAEIYVPRNDDFEINDKGVR